MAPPTNHPYPNGPEPKANGPFPFRLAWAWQTGAMRSPLVLVGPLLAAALAAAPPATAQDFPPAPLAGDFRPLPLHEAADIVADRYRGRLIAARLVPPNPHEQGLGVDLVREMRLLTPQGNLLAIRLDARDGRFLEVAGIGQTEARK